MDEHPPKGRRAIEPGPISSNVAKNLRRLRKLRGLTTRQLSFELELAGRPIPASGITRMEKGERQVTVDELVTLALALQVSPTLLMLPIERPSGTAQDPEYVPLTSNVKVAWEVAWRWMHGQRPPKSASDREIRGFWWENRPYESDNPADEAAVVLNSRIQGAWHLELSRDEPGQLTRPGRGNLWEVPVDELHRLGRLPGGSAPERSGDQEGDVES